MQSPPRGAPQVLAQPPGGGASGWLVSGRGRGKACSVLGQRTFATPLGTCALAFSERGLVAAVLPSQTLATTLRALANLVRARKLAESPAPEGAPEPPWVESSVATVSDLLSGVPVDTRSIPLDTRGLSDFRVRIYEAARAIPFGSRATYGELAQRADRARAARAVGRAMATNPWPLIVPCHRVVDSAGELHGFSAPGGLKTKATLLEIEARAVASSPCDSPKKGAKMSRGGSQGSLPF